jgi:peptidylprolyl isomerase/peptidyl-prolyl cis-trans isomerase B (cyclophilin B)
MTKTQKTTLLIASILVLAGGIGYAVYLNTQNPTETSAPVAETSPTQPSTEAAPAPTGETKGKEMSQPDLTVDAQGLSKATVKITTPHGVIKYKFYTNDAPNTVKRMVELIQQGFYNGLTFHRVIPGFVAQGGDPNGNGTGGSGQKLKAEFNQRKHVDGTLAMARAADPNSADAQFYICLGPQPHLDNSYTVFGQVIEGMDAVRKLQVGDKMTSVTIE